MWEYVKNPNSLADASKKDPYTRLLKRLPKLSPFYQERAMELLIPESWKKYEDAATDRDKGRYVKIAKKNFLPLLNKAITKALVAGQEPPTGLAELLLDARLLAGNTEALQQSIRGLLQEPITEDLRRRADYSVVDEGVQALPADRGRLIKARLALFDREYSLANRLFDPVQSEEPASGLAPWVLADIGRLKIALGPREADLEFFTSLAGSPDNLRQYIVHFYAGRLAQLLGKGEEALGYYEKALELAPDEGQKNACLWYLLQSSFAIGPELMLSTLKNRLAQSPKADYHFDQIDNLQAYFLANKKYSAILDLYIILQKFDAPKSQAHSLWLVLRLLESNVLPFNEAQKALALASSTEKEAWLAHEYAGLAKNPEAPLYYQIMAREKSGSLEGLFGEDRADSSVDKKGIDEISSYLKDLADLGTGDDVLQFIAKKDAYIDVAHIQFAARLLAERHQFYESIRCMGYVLNWEGYELAREDYELLYPRAYEEEISLVAAQHDLPGEVLRGLVRTESAFNAGIASWAGAVGLAQLMPATAQEVARKIHQHVDIAYNGDAPDLLDIKTNLHLGAWYLSDWIKRLQSPMLALFAYNAGPGRLRRWQREFSHLPEDLFLEALPFSETRNYGRKVLSSAVIYGLLNEASSLENSVRYFFSN